MSNKPCHIETIVIEGCDLTGKTTLKNDLNKLSNHRWNVIDRSHLTCVIYGMLYKRDNIPTYLKGLEKYQDDMKNIIIVLHPSWEEIERRYAIRGDEIQNLNSLKEIYFLYDYAINNLLNPKNSFVFKENTVNVKKLISSLIKYECLPSAEQKKFLDNLKDRSK